MPSHNVNAKQLSNPNPKPSPTPAPTLTLGYVAVQLSTSESMGESRSRIRHLAKLVPIRVRSIAAGEDFVELAEPISLSPNTEVVGVTFRPVRGGDISLPESDASGLEFTPARIPVFGIVRSREGTLVLAAIDEEITLPPDYELVGVLAAPVGTHALDAYDAKTDEMYRLGYSFPNTIQPDWAGLALERRERTSSERAAERREREAERRTEEMAKRTQAESANAPEKDWASVGAWRTSDREVVRRIIAANGHLTTRTRPVFDSEDNLVATLVEDPNGNGAAIEAEVQRVRVEKGDAADRHFERLREQF